ncbi:hypothetical protein [Leptospira kirschneri]|uniref:hypothetical protein n=1 Tax=Leptospira kirschneri TaxID=29507 RepID=UPI0021C67A7B|nr:hypothetical protein [Leptospira kirschneri]UML80563.1 hypothetical protein FH602_20415 [Leptospira kirschneri]UML80577.1 hypothetical protein FH602_20490 [Leptospira kirschneri]
MKQVILNVPDNKYPFLMELLQNLKFVRVKKTIEEKEPTKKEILADLAESVKQVKLHKEGKIKLRSAYELIDEL